MTLHEIVIAQADAWRERVIKLYPMALAKWCTDETTPKGLRRRVAVARKSPGSKLCVGFFKVMYEADKEGKANGLAVIEQSKVYDPPIKADGLPFVDRELFKAFLQNVAGIVGATFTGGTEIVKHYASVDDMAQDMEKL